MYSVVQADIRSQHAHAYAYPNNAEAVFLVRWVDMSSTKYLDHNMSFSFAGTKVLTSDGGVVTSSLGLL